jgi:hypothetical protein
MGEEYREQEQPKAEGKPRRITKDGDTINISLPGWIVKEEVGLGDAVASVLYRVGFTNSCKGCKRRQAALNRRVVLSRR